MLRTSLSDIWIHPLFPQLWPVSQTLLMKSMYHNMVLMPPCFIVCCQGDIVLSVLTFASCISYKCLSDKTYACTYTLGHWVFPCQCTGWHPWGTQCYWWRVSSSGNIPYRKSSQVYPTQTKPASIRFMLFGDAILILEGLYPVSKTYFNFRHKSRRARLKVCLNL